MAGKQSDFDLFFYLDFEYVIYIYLLLSCHSNCEFLSLRASNCLILGDIWYKYLPYPQVNSTHTKPSADPFAHGHVRHRLSPPASRLSPALSFHSIDGVQAPADPFRHCYSKINVTSRSNVANLLPYQRLQQPATSN